MDERTNSSLDGLFESAWASALIKTNSTNYKKTGENGSMENITTLYDYLREGRVATMTRVDMDLKQSEKLRKYYVMQNVQDVQGRGENSLVDLVCDNRGHDLVMVYISGTDVKVEVSEEILRNNKGLLGKAAVSKDGTRLEIGDLEELARIMEPNNLQKLVEQIEKYDSPKIRNLEDARKRIGKLPESDKDKAKVVGSLAQTHSEEELEQEAAEQSFDGSNLATIVKLCKENGLRPEDIKQSLTVVEPSTLIDDIDNSRTNIRREGGEVLVLRFKNREASAGPDRIYMVQDGQLLPQDQTNDAKVTELLEQNKGNNVKVNQVDDTRREDVLEELIALKLEYEQRVESVMASIGTAESKQETIEHIRGNTIGKINAIIDSYHPQITEGNKIAEEISTGVNSIADDPNKHEAAEAAADDEAGRDPREGNHGIPSLEKKY